MLKHTNKAYTILFKYSFKHCSLQISFFMCDLIDEVKILVSGKIQNNLYSHVLRNKWIRNDSKEYNAILY